MDERTVEIVASAFLLFIGCGALAFMSMCGVFTHRILDDSPFRFGPMTLGDLLVGFGLYVIGMGVAVSVSALIVQSPSGATTADLTAWQMLVGMIATQIGMVPAAAYALIRLSHGYTRPKPAGAVRAVAMGVVGLIALAPVLLLVMSLSAHFSQLFGERPPQIAHDVLRLLIEEPSGAVKWGLILSAVVGAPLMEETVFRGLMQTSLLQSGVIAWRWTAIVVTSVLFSLIHIGIVEPAALPMLYVLSLGLGYVYERTGNLLAPIAMHAAFNGIQVALALYFHGSQAS